MTQKDKNLQDIVPVANGIKEPMVIFPLRQYETLMEHLEDVEDLLAVMERANEPTLSQRLSTTDYRLSTIDYRLSSIDY